MKNGLGARAKPLHVFSENKEVTAMCELRTSFVLDVPGVSSDG